MSKSISAKIVSDLLKLWPKRTPEESERRFAELLQEGEKPTPPPRTIATRHEDSANGRVFHINEKSESNYVVFYIHGGAYVYDIIAFHWLFIEKLVKSTDAQVIVPAYRLVPFATYKEAYDLIVPLYQACREANPEKKIIMMGDSAGGGLSLALTEFFKSEGIRQPDELVLLSPWVDVSMENEDIPKYASVDPFLDAEAVKPAGKRWAGDLDVHDWRISPIYGDLTGIRNATVFVGTDGILYPDITKCFGMLDRDASNELIVGEGMNHVYPLFPIPEAVSADNRIFQVVMR